MRLAKKDKKIFYVSYFIAENNGVKYYSDPIKANGIYCRKSGTIIPEENGKRINYNATIVLEFKDNNIPINTNSVLWIDKEPTNKLGYNYVVRFKSEVRDDLFTLYVELIDEDCHEIWFEHNGVILPFKLVYDYETKVGIVRLDTYIPFTKDTKIWEREPTDIDDTSNLIELDDISIENNSILLKFYPYE